MTPEYLTSHEFAKELLEGPDIPIAYRDENLLGVRRQRAADSRCAIEEMIVAVKSVQDWDGTDVGECIDRLEALLSHANHQPETIHTENTQPETHP